MNELKTFRMLLHHDTLKELKRIAKDNGLSASTYARFLLTRHVREERKGQQAREGI